MIRSFNILDKEQNIEKRLLLEASAGTGKTFAIENLFVRLLLEGLEIDEILVVTFTKAAALDLNVRIRANLERAFHHLKNPSLEMPSYLEAIQDSLQAQNRLQEALLRFDEASISTIHGFCYEALQEYAFEAKVCPGNNEEDFFLSDQKLLEVIENFFRTHLDLAFITPAELELLLKKHRNIDGLKRSLLNTLKKGIEIDEPKSIERLYCEFKEEFRKLSFEKEKILNDFYALAPHYKEICDRSGNIKKEPLERVLTFASLFEKKAIEYEDFNSQVKDQLYFVQAFHPSQRKAKAKIPFLFYPELISQLTGTLWPIIHEASNYLHSYARLAKGCQAVLSNYLEENGKLEFSALLRKTLQSIDENDGFKKQINNRFHAVIIDEFQDTDPLQWRIFEKLFIDNKSANQFLYLVGDPKQSIYAFRSADIYTYLSAEERLGKENKGSLDTNFRSETKLVKALNRLFDDSSTPGWLSLPCLDSSLPYPPVKASEKIKPWPFKDLLGAVHFCVADGSKWNLEHLEERYFFNYYAEEIKRLNILEGVAFQDIAILVSDRFQMKRLSAYLKDMKIPVSIQRPDTLGESLALKALYQLLSAVLQPKNEGVLKIALGGPLIGFSLNEMSFFEDSSERAKVIEKLLALRQAWLDKGFGSFFEAFLDSNWKDFSIREAILARDKGEYLLQQILQTAFLLVEYEEKNAASPENVLEYLKELMLLDDDEEELKVAQDVTKGAVNILTLFASKGLEYGIVFVHALLKRTKLKESLIPQKKDGSLRLTVLEPESTEYLAYLDEIDAEKMRQLYVALTRARHRVYISCLSALNSPKRGTASPIELFLARMGREQCSIKELYVRLEDPVVKNLDQVAQDGLITQCQLEERSDSEFELNEAVPELQLPGEVSVPGKPLFIHSFSSLTKFIVPEANLSAPLDFKASEKTAHTLPAGKDTGNLLHLLLQHIAYNSTVNGLEQQVDPFIKGTPYEEWQKILAEIVQNAITLPLGEEKFSLAMLKPADVFKEMEFICSDELVSHLPPCNEVKGFLNGIIDLAFTANGKYYLLDWKSNWLGPNSSFYTPDRLELAMHSHHYFLQATLYTAAFKQFLSLYDEKPFTDCFGGVFYLFLRGLNPLEPDLGVYHFFPEAL